MAASHPTLSFFYKAEKRCMSYKFILGRSIIRYEKQEGYIKEDGKRNETERNETRGLRVSPPESGNQIVDFVLARY